MKACLPFFFFAFVLYFGVSAQSNILSTNPTAKAILKGQYDPANYLPSATTSLEDIPALLQSQISQILAPLLKELELHEGGSIKNLNNLAPFMRIV